MRRELARLFIPHAHAERLLDAKLDGELGDGGDEAWLESHLGRCPRCARAKAGRERLMGALEGMKGTKAPEGFAGRVLLAAKTRSPIEPAETARRMMPLAQLATGGVLALLVVGGLVGLIAVGSTEKAQHTKIETSGGTPVSIEMTDKPQFLVRAPGVGAAKARSQITQIVSAHRGTFQDSGGMLVARIPRAELIGLTKDLANSGRYKMSQAEGSELSPSMETIVIGFELE